MPKMHENASYSHKKNPKMFWEGAWSHPSHFQVPPYIQILAKPYRELVNTQKMLVSSADRMCGSPPILPSVPGVDSKLGHRKSGDYAKYESFFSNFLVWRSYKF